MLNKMEAKSSSLYLLIYALTKLPHP
jgi:hypothetical protein